MGMGARIRMTTGTVRMPTDLRLLTLTQWLSPSFPVGSFAFSHGLETAVACGWVTDKDTLFDWLLGLLEHGSGQADATWLALAYQAESRSALEDLNTQARAFTGAAERLREGARQGQSFARVASEVWSIDIPPVQLPLGLGYAAKLQKLDLDAVTALYLQAFLGNLVSAAQRLMPLGQSDAQDVLARLNPHCLRVADAAKSANISDIVSNAFLSDIAAMKHENLEPRLFQS